MSAILNLQRKSPVAKKSGTRLTIANSGKLLVQVGMSSNLSVLNYKLKTCVAPAQMAKSTTMLGLMSVSSRAISSKDRMIAVSVSRLVGFAGWR